MTTRDYTADELELLERWRDTPPTETVTIDNSALWGVYGILVQAVKAVGRLLGYRVTVTKVKR